MTDTPDSTSVAAEEALSATQRDLGVKAWDLRGWCIVHHDAHSLRDLMAEHVDVARDSRPVGEAELALLRELSDKASPGRWVGRPMPQAEADGHRLGLRDTEFAVAAVNYVRALLQAGPAAVRPATEAATRTSADEPAADALGTALEGALAGVLPIGMPAHYRAHVLVRLREAGWDLDTAATSETITTQGLAANRIDSSTPVVRARPSGGGRCDWRA